MQLKICLLVSGSDKLIGYASDGAGAVPVVDEQEQVRQTIGTEMQTITKHDTLML